MRNIMDLRLVVWLCILSFKAICSSRSRKSALSVDYSHNFSSRPSINESFPSYQFGGYNKFRDLNLISQFRLSEYVIPKHYKIFLFPNIAEGTFLGEVFISITLLQEQNHIRLHVKYLEIYETTLRLENDDDDSFLPVVGHENTKLEYWIIQQPNGVSTFQAGDYQLRLRYRGSLTNGIVGFYRSSYLDSRDNITKYVAATKFEPTYARRAFPCFDEPRFKATFSIGLVKSSNLVAFSNMPEVIQLPDVPWEGLTTVIFQRSVPMVTYLVAVAIGDFQCLGSQTKRGLPVQVCTAAPRIKDAEYASSITSGILDYYEQYFGIPFPLPKLDLVEIPEYPSGATEHWGMISFKHESILFPSGVGSADEKQFITITISHELAHSWFGNLVSIKFWNDVWLNEGFATYMQYKGANAAQPEWDMEEQFASNSMTGVLGTDYGPSSRPLVEDGKMVVTPDEIANQFDSIAYEKGACIIRMLVGNILGPSLFRSELTAFLHKYAYGNVETKDLWESLQPTGTNPGKNISRIMQTWTSQPGYPVLRLEQRGSDGIWFLKQERFVPTHGVSPKDGYPYRWDIPVGIQWPVGQASNVKLTKKIIIWSHQDVQTVTLPLPTSVPWVKLNVGQIGYYRVLYPIWMYENIKPKMMRYFSPKERCGMVDDAFALSAAGHLPYSTSLAFAQFLKTEDKFIPWSCAIDQLKQLGQRIQREDPQSYVIFKKYVMDLIRDIYQKLRWDGHNNEDHGRKLLKPLIFSLACENGHLSCRMLSQKRSQTSNKNTHAKTPAEFPDVLYDWRKIMIPFLSGNESTYIR